MNSLDANVVLRFLLDDLPVQSARAERLILRSQCYVSDVILTEVIFVMEKLSGISRPDIATLLRKLMGIPTVLCNSRLIDGAIGLYTTKRQLSFPDCYIAIEGMLSNDKVYSFDKDLQKYGGNHVKEP